MSNMVRLILQNFQNESSHKQTIPIKSVIPAGLGMAGIAIKAQPSKDSFEASSSDKINRQVFINDFIKGNDENVDRVLKTYDFAQFGTKGLPLDYPRKNFVDDIIKKVKPNQELLSKFNLNRTIFDIDGIAKIPSKTEDIEDGLKEAVEKFYNNETKFQDRTVNSVMNKLIKGMPEFTMTVGKKQHGTHIYSVDIHSLIVLQKSLNHPDYEKLSNESKQVLKLAILMHDFGKKGNTITPGHAKQSKLDAQMILDNYDISPEIKKRVINIIENHHWFQNFNTGIYDKKDVLSIFDTPEDLLIAKIMAKADLESISDDFHRYILIPYKYLTQKEFDREFAKKIQDLKF